MPDTTRTYSNDEITVVWQPDMCIHSRICWMGLVSVFNPKKRPWINMSAEATEKILEQVQKCPSGALSFYRNDAMPESKPVPDQSSLPLLNIEVQTNGPLIITTGCQITHSNGSTETREGRTALCRCGASENKPFCDGSHKTQGFKG
jgi:uncharacterized Fe-S cluster protein YjdI